MSNDVPISDALCEAMEYLCKLGTNLRARSESLKEKRIRKDKLRNSHAVQKAADKVLLICELSKKSLENVETGVRRVLSLVNERSVKPHVSISKKSEYQNDLQYFKYQSCKLRICKKVPVKHYLSAKVLARKMSISTHQKYPVYYNCKLYRQRKNEEKFHKSNDSSLIKLVKGVSENEIVESKTKEFDVVDVDSDSLEKTTGKIQNNDDSSEQRKDNNSSENIRDKHIIRKRHKRKSSTKSNTQNTTKYKKIKLIDDSSDNSNERDADQVEGLKELTKESEDLRSTCPTSDLDTEKSIKNDHSSDNSNERDADKVKGLKELTKESEDLQSTHPTSDLDTEKSIKNDHDRIETESALLTGKDSQNVKNNDMENLNSQQINDDKESCSTNTQEVDPGNLAKSLNSSVECLNEINISDTSLKSKKDEQSSNMSAAQEKQPCESDIQEVANNNNVNDADVIEKNESDKVTNQEKSLENSNDDTAIREESVCVDINSLSKSNDIVLDSDEEELKSSGNNDEPDKNTVSRPLIKCVNINKLLKQDFASTDNKTDLKNTPNSKTTIKNKQVKAKRKNSRKSSSDSDEDYWRQKRKEVEAFKPKKFSIAINRLPKYTNNFLQQYSLKKIVHKNSIIFALQESAKGDEKNLENNIDTVKNALMNDSESEKSDSEVIPTVDLAHSQDDNVITDHDKTVTEKAKDKEITIDNNGRNIGDTTEELKQSLLYESDSDGLAKSTEGITKDLNNIKMAEQVKNYLLNDSDSDKSKNNDLPESNIQSQGEKQKTPVRELSTHNEAQNSEKKEVEETPKSKRKRIMESMKAKKMLLTYSSSDTEDEQLVNALKEIKDELLKGFSSDENNGKKEERKEKPSSSSESDENILCKLKKRNAEKRATREKQKKNEDNNKKIGRSRAEPRGSSQNSDSQDSHEKNIDGLTNLNNLMKSRSRRNSSTTDANSVSDPVKKTKKMPKAPLLNEEELLNADSGSDVASAGESDGPDEDLPPVSLSTLNGSGVDHLAKDDLLGESDTSTSNNEKDEGNKIDTDDDNPKLKRRKANAISSDSEVGSSRKNDRDVKVSDFEDSEDESSDTVKKNKRKKRENDSDASTGSTSNDGSKKKRRRIKQLNESDASGSDTENEGRNKHGRKNIRKVMGKNQLEEATKKAAREEKERIARITERQKLYNNLEFDESGKPDEVVLEKVVLDFDPETKEPLIEVDRGLVKKLKPHQANGIKFMWNACFESVKRIKKDRGSGCILAHCMGLGKTLQVVSLTHTLLIHGDLTTVNRVLVVCPLSTVLNWVNEFKMWLKYSITEYEVDVYELSRYKQNSERAFQLQQWFEGGGVCVLGYEMFRNLSADNPKKFKKKMLRHFQEALVDPGPDLVVCDEGHLLKNEKTSLSQSMNRVKTQRRIVLTGTPLQNNLKEYYCMVQFVKPNLLGKYNEYLNRFVNPITNGQYTDSTEHDIRIMKRRSHVLHKMLDGAVQRRDYGVLAPFLPPKHEYVLFITLTEIQSKLYQYYLDNYSRRPLPGKSSGFLFPDFQSLQRIWTHPLVLKYNSERYEIMQQKKREREEEEDSEGSLADFIDDDSTPNESTSEESSDDLSDVSDDSRKKSKKKKSAKKNKGKDSKVSTRRGTRANPVELEEDDANDVAEIKAENPTEWWIRLVTEEELEDLRHSHKLVLLFDILRQCEAIGDKLLVFSQSLYSLDLIEHFLGKVDEATQEGRIDEKLGGHVGSWSPGVDYFRLDGSTSCENRSIWCKNFNREDNPRARLFLISTRAGGLGINLVAANRVVIFDVSWNPSHDVQSIFRVYRFGQKKPCYVYRFLAMGTMEEKIYERQVTKQAISKRVIDEQQIDRHYAENDLAELYKFEPRPPTPRPLPPLPKDRLFAEMLKEHEAQIYKYHEHDSLLENKEEETLSEEERKAAWEDFENEKNRPPPAPFPSPWPMHNGMVPGLLAQQQQQLTYAALASMLRKDMPNINDNQIRDMLPLIFNANPGMFGGYDYGLMQKMAEIYKYAPGAMMNPAMMNQVMNPGVAVGGVGGVGGGGVGGSSGLQYSPPWQRQHQQQQQMRLQQLMQHQNQMGAKYYAGGLGSRDPVAMALQQQRAREIMAGEQRGRPRGRPPQRPPAPPADVVNLDSD